MYEKMDSRLGSIKILFLVLLLQTVIWASEMGPPNSQSLTDALKTQDGRDGSFTFDATTKEVLRDSFVTKEVSRHTSCAEPSTTVAKIQDNSCTLSAEALAQIFKPTAFQWLVDDDTMELLHNDLQLLIECTRPRDQIIFINKKIVTLARTVNIVHELELIGTATSTQVADRCSDKVTSFTCPQSRPAFIVSATRFMAMNLRITNCVGSSNSAVIDLGDNSNSTLYRLYINDNANRAIIVRRKASLLLMEANLERNIFNKHGAALYVDGFSHVSVLDSNFKGNAATEGHSAGAIFVFYANVVFIKGCTFTDNIGGHEGGAVAIYQYNEISIQESTFADNSAYVRAGAIAATTECTIEVLRSVFANNTCGKYGGAMHFDDELDISIQESTFANNFAGGNGGAIDIYKSSKLSIKASLFTNNTSNVWGGAFNLYNNISLSVIETTFTNNVCGGSGGAVTAHEKIILIVQGSNISNNVAKQGGGGFNLVTSCTFTAINSTIFNNSATNGGAMKLDKSNALGIQGCTVNDNTAKDYGGAFYLDNDNMGAIFDSYLSDNHAGHVSGPYGAAIYSKDNSNSLLLLNSDITRRENGNTIATYRGLTKEELSEDAYKSRTLSFPKNKFRFVCESFCSMKGIPYSKCWSGHSSTKTLIKIEEAIEFSQLPAFGFNLVSSSLPHGMETALTTLLNSLHEERCQQAIRRINQNSSSIMNISKTGGLFLLVVFKNLHEMTDFGLDQFATITDVVSSGDLQVIKCLRRSWNKLI